MVLYARRVTCSFLVLFLCSSILIKSVICDVSCRSDKVIFIKNNELVFLRCFWWTLRETWLFFHKLFQRKVQAEHFTTHCQSSWTNKFQNNHTPTANRWPWKCGDYSASLRTDVTDQAGCHFLAGYWRLTFDPGHRHWHAATFSGLLMDFLHALQYLAVTSKGHWEGNILKE